MSPTRLRDLLGLALVAGLVGYLLITLVGFNDFPALPPFAAVTLVLLAVVELGMARIVRDRVLQRSRAGARVLHPEQVARAAVLAKASSAGGALLAGLYGGLLVFLVPETAEQAGADVVVAVISASGALVLVGAALLLERACRTPGSD